MTVGIIKKVNAKIRARHMIFLVCTRFIRLTYLSLFYLIICGLLGLIAVFFTLRAVLFIVSFQYI